MKNLFETHATENENKHVHCPLLIICQPLLLFNKQKMIEERILLEENAKIMQSFIINVSQ